MIAELSLAEARRIALTAQGFGATGKLRGKSVGVVDVVKQLGAIQIDSINVLVRSHYLPTFSRLGYYDMRTLDEATYGVDRQLFEYWGHEACFLHLNLRPLLGWRMERAARGIGMYPYVARFARERMPFIDSVLREVTQRGPTTSRELAISEAKQDGWWSWSDAKIALEYLFWTGRLMVLTRRNFERVYDLTERVLPSWALAVPNVQNAVAIQELLRIAARALGVATARDLRDYFRLPTSDVNALLPHLLEDASLAAIGVEGCTETYYLAPDTELPRSVRASALLSPFDSLIWQRNRLRTLFAFDYRIEVYTPAPSRVHGYYVLPFLLGSRFVARVDVKADKRKSRLLVRAIHFEPGAQTINNRRALSVQLASLARQLALEDVMFA